MDSPCLGYVNARVQGAGWNLAPEPSGTPPIGRTCEASSVAQILSRRWKRRWRRFWPAAGGTLALVATLWTVLLGKTLPELFRADPVEAFYAGLSETCRDGSSAIAASKPVLFAQVDPLTRPQFLEAKDAVRIATRSTLAAVTAQTLPRLVRMSPPSALRADFNHFRAAWRSITYSLSKTSRLDAEITGIKSPSDLAVARRSRDQVVALRRSALTLGAGDCADLAQAIQLSVATTVPLSDIIEEALIDSG